MDPHESQLNNLALAHYVVGGFMALFACFPLIHMGIGIAMVFGDGSFFGETETPPPEFLGWMFFGMGLAFFLLGQAIAVCLILSGRFLKKRKNYTFSFVFACIACAVFPFGTLLGVFTIIALSKEPVKRMYERV